MCLWQGVSIFTLNFGLLESRNRSRLGRNDSSIISKKLKGEFPNIACGGSCNVPNISLKPVPERVSGDFVKDLQQKEQGEGTCLHYMMYNFS